MTVTQTLKHPITVFIIAVLAVVAIGVGVMAGTQTSKVYGPSWGRFTASFPGRMRVIYSPPVPSASFGDPLRYTTTFDYANQRFNGWVAYAPLTGVILPADLRAVVVTEVTRHVYGSGLAMRQIAHPTGGYLSGTPPREDKTVVNGLTVVDFHRVAVMASVKPRLSCPTVGSCGTCWRHRSYNQNLWITYLSGGTAYLPR